MKAFENQPSPFLELESDWHYAVVIAQPLGEETWTRIPSLLQVSLRNLSKGTKLEPQYPRLQKMTDSTFLI